MKTIILKTICCVFLLSGCANLSQKIITDNAQQQTTSPAWQQVSTGLAYAEIEAISNSSQNLKDLLIVKIDPKKYAFSIYQNKDQENSKSIQDIAKETGAVLAFNGGFFTQDFKPTGLLISKGEKLRQQSPADLLNGTFTINNNQIPELITGEELVNGPKHPFAIQNGPVLIDQYGQIKISKDTGKASSRTAIGLDQDNNIILILIRQTILNSDNLVSLYEFAHLLKEATALQGLNLHSMLNLDGGSSTGMVIGENYFPEMEKVQNVIIVKNDTNAKQQ